jgi:hypothetical protein
LGAGANRYRWYAQGVYRCQLTTPDGCRYISNAIDLRNVTPLAKNVVIENVGDEFVSIYELPDPGTAPPEAPPGLRFGPNPTTGRFLVQYGGATAPVVVLELINYQGQTLLQQALTPQAGLVQGEVDGSALPAGLYMLWLRDGERTERRKIIITR